MELTLTRTSDFQVTVTCDGAPSHTFDLRALTPDAAIPGGPPPPLQDPVTYGKSAFQALFPVGSLAAQALAVLPLPGHILLVTTDDAVQAVPWELTHGPDAFVACDHHLVRGLPAARRLPPPARDGNLHIVALPSQLLEDDLPPLNIEGEWQRLADQALRVQPDPHAPGAGYPAGAQSALADHRRRLLRPGRHQPGAGPGARHRVGVRTEN